MRRPSLTKRVAQHLPVLLLFTALFAAMYPGCVLGITSGFIGGSRGDAGIYIYTESLNAKRFFSWPSEGFDIPSFYPWRGGLAFSDNFILPGLAAKLLQPLLGSEPLTYNAIIVSALVLNGFCAYLLAIKLTGSRPASIFAGFVFMCFPYFAFHRGHPQLQFAFWIPLTLRSTLVFAEKRTLSSAAWIGAWIAGAFFCAVYYAMYCYLLAAVVLLGSLALRPKGWTAKHLGFLLVGNLPWLLLLAPAALPYVQTRDALGTYPFSLLRRHSPSLTAFIAPPAIEDLWSRHMRHISRMEGFLFFGFTTLAITLASAFVWIRNVKADCLHLPIGRWVRWALVASGAAVVVGIARAAHFLLNPSTKTEHHIAWISSETFWIVLAASALVLVAYGIKARAREALSQHETLGLLTFISLFFIFATLGVHDSGSSAIKAPELYRLLVHLPGWDALRGVSRLGIVAVLSLTMVAACGVAAALRRPALRGRAASWALPAVLISLSALELHTRVDRPVPMLPAPEVYDEALHLPTDDAIVALPIHSATVRSRDFMFLNSYYMLWLRDARNPLVNGFSGKVPLFHSLYAHELDSFPSRKALSYLGELVGVHYVVTNKKFLGREASRAIKKAAALLPDEIQLLHCDRHGNCVYRVDPVLDSRELAHPELLVPPAPEARTLAFDLMPVGDPAAQNAALNLKVNISGRTTVSTPVISGLATDHWVHATVEIPANNERVSPTFVDLSPQGVPGVLIRNVSVSPVAH